MPQIIITTDARDGSAREVHREWISSADVDTETAGNLLVERIGWALSDADDLEHPAAGDGGSGRHRGRAA